MRAHVRPWHKAEVMATQIDFRYGTVPVMVPDGVLAEVGELILNDAKENAEIRGAKDISVACGDGDPRPATETRAAPGRARA